MTKVAVGQTLPAISFTHCQWMTVTRCQCESISSVDMCLSALHLSLSFSLSPYLWCFKNSFVSLLPDINRLRAQMFSNANTNRAWTRIHAALSKLLNKQAQRRNQSISTDRITSSRAHDAVKIKIERKKKHFCLTYLTFLCTSKLRDAFYELRQ